ncbi:MAG: hypothetical protein ABL995_04820 [Bryobacteraceae bacterium]
MPDLKKYWQEIRTLASSLDESVWLTSLEDARRGIAGGGVVEVQALTAAKLLHAKSHRRSTEAEIQQYLERQQEKKRDAFHEKLRARGIAVTPVDRA